MKITEIKLRELKPIGPIRASFQSKKPETMPRLLLTVCSDEGAEGNCMTWLTGQFGADPLKAKLECFRRTLVGQDPRMINKIAYEMTCGFAGPDLAYSAVDIALWDLLGKYYDAPVHQLLGGYRDKMKAYVGGVVYNTPEEFLTEAKAYHAKGYHGYKLHSCGDPEIDIETIRLLAKEFPGWGLSFDATTAYNRETAIRVGRVLEECNYIWYEDPSNVQDYDLMRMLRIKLDIPLSCGDGEMAPIKKLPSILGKQAVDIWKSIGDAIGGISAMRIVNHACEAFGVTYDAHAYGTTSVMAAHFNLMLSNPNCFHMVEIAEPDEFWAAGFAETMKIDENGYVAAPTTPGLGYDIDKDQVENMTVAVF